jgi:hypothetical protein
VFDRTADGKKPFSYQLSGDAEIADKSGASVTLAEFLIGVAQRLAPIVRLHSRDIYRPSSVEWFLQRCTLVDGSANVDYSNLNLRGGFKLPEELRIMRAGPLDQCTLSFLSSSDQFGPAHYTDDHSLWPMEAPPGGTATYHFRTIETSENTAFSDYQFETLRGQPIVNNLCSAPVYCRLSRSGDDIFITYYFFYPYNGDLGGPDWDAEALAQTSGWEAHIGDLERVTARIRVSVDLGTVELLDTTLEWHGNEDVRRQPPFSFPPTVYTKVPRFTVYSCWHSHATHAAPGVYDTNTSWASDYAGAGPIWETGSNVVFIDERVPWIRYNGIFGANISVNGMLAHFGAHPMKNGPEGPAFHALWTRSTTITTPHLALPC